VGKAIAKPTVYTEGIKQLAGYMDTLACQVGWLVVFDRRVNVSWEDTAILIVSK